MRTFTTIVFCLMVGLFSSASVAAQGAEKQVDADEGWVSLVAEDGLEGWATEEMDKYWKLEDGILVGENPDKKESRLWTEKQYADYELIVEYITPSEDYDGGVYLRGPSHQVQIGVSRSQKIDLTACLYCPKDGNGKYPQMSADIEQKVIDAHEIGQWNTLRMVTKGKNIKTYLNGELINDYDGVKYPEKGKIGLQLHGGVHMKMSFRRIKLRSLTGD